MAYTTPLALITKTTLGCSLAAIALSVTGVASAEAATLSYSATTTGAPTFNRPAAPGFEGVNNPINELSRIGTAVPFFSQPFVVDTTRLYDVLGTQNFDAVQFLYQDFFDPGSPLINVIAGNDPFPDTGNSGFEELTLIAGTQYFLVTTGFDNSKSSFGDFTNTLTGSGTITLNSEAIPEPTTVTGALVVGVLGGLLKRKLKR
jgi:hypothetical protein